jgi:hypothetical protein
MGFWHMRPRIAFMAFLSSPYILDARLRYYVVVVVVVFTTKKKKSSTQHAQLLLTLCCAVFAIETMPTHEKSVSQHHSSCSHPQQDRHNSLKFDFFLNLNTAQSLSRVELSGWVPKFPPLVKKKPPRASRHSRSEDAHTNPSPQAKGGKCAMVIKTGERAARNLYRAMYKSPATAPKRPFHGCWNDTHRTVREEPKHQTMTQGDELNNASKVDI